MTYAVGFAYVPSTFDGKTVVDEKVDTSFPHLCENCGDTFYATKDTALTLCISCEQNQMISESEKRVLDGNR